MSECIEVEIDGDRIRVRAPVGRKLTPEDVDTIRRIRDALREEPVQVKDWTGRVIGGDGSSAPDGHSLRIPHAAGSAGRDCQECHDMHREDPVVNIEGPRVIRASDLCPVALGTSSGTGTHNFKPVRGNGAAPTYVETCTACGATWRGGKITPGPDPVTEGTPK